MSDVFDAIRITKDKADTPRDVEIAQLSEADLIAGDVTAAVEYSTVNYKDGLAITENPRSFAGFL